MPFIALVLTDVTSLGTGGNIVQSLGWCSPTLLFPRTTVSWFGIIEWCLLIKYDI